MHIDCTTPQLQQSFNLICTFWLFSKAKHASSKAELRLLAQIFNNFSIPFLPHFIFLLLFGFFFSLSNKLSWVHAINQKTVVGHLFCLFFPPYFSLLNKYNWSWSKKAPLKEIWNGYPSKVLGSAQMSSLSAPQFPLRWKGCLAGIPNAFWQPGFLSGLWKENISWPNTPSLINKKKNTHSKHHIGKEFFTNSSSLHLLNREK